MMRLFLLMLTAAACLVGCGGGGHPVGPEHARDLGVRSKRGAASQTRTDLTMTVKEEGVAAPGWVIEVRRSVSGVAGGDSWSGLTDAEGRASVAIVVDPEGPFRRVGISGYYRIKAIESSSGVLRGEWGSIPLNGIEALYLPVGGRALVNVPVIFEDAGLEMTVRALAGVTDRELMTSDIGHLADLDLAREEIATLAGLEHLNTLDSLTLTENRVVDLRPLSGLKDLRHLDLDHNQVVDLAPLRGLRALTFLDLAYNAVSDLSILPRLRSLETLNLDANEVQDLSALSGLSLIGLRLRQNQIEDIGDLARLTELLYLDLSHNPILDFTPVSGLTQLEDLAVEGCDVTDVSVFEDLTNLTWLSLIGNGIDDISPLSGMFLLEHLDLRENDLRDISALSDFGRLETLALIGNSVEDISVLSTMPSLKTVALQENGISDLTPLAGLSGLERVLLENNAITDLSPLVENEGIGAEDVVDVRSNPLSNEALAVQIPALEARGVIVDR